MGRRRLGQRRVSLGGVKISEKKIVSNIRERGKRARRKSLGGFLSDQEKKIGKLKGTMARYLSAKKEGEERRGRDTPRQQAGSLNTEKGKGLGKRKVTTPKG